MADQVKLDPVKIPQLPLGDMIKMSQQNFELVAMDVAFRLELLCFAIAFGDSEDCLVFKR